MSEANSTSKNQKRLCDFPACGQPHHAKGFCTGHFQQHNSGKPLVALYLTKRPPGSPPRIEYDEAICHHSDLNGPCHVSRARKNSDGYSQVFFNSRHIGVHIYVWERDVGPIPKGMVVDHKCRVRSCCNVDHLRIVTKKVNSTENVIGSMPLLNAAKSHCKHGHPFDEENTYIAVRKNGRSRRQCRICKRDQKRSAASLK